MLRKGFTELGFGRAGAAKPLNEELALDVFDTNVPEVLESLREAKQPDSTREVCGMHFHEPVWTIAIAYVMFLRAHNFRLGFHRASVAKARRSILMYPML